MNLAVELGATCATIRASGTGVTFGQLEMLDLSDVVKVAKRLELANMLMLVQLVLEMELVKLVELMKPMELEELGVLSREMAG